MVGSGCDTTHYSPVMMIRVIVSSAVNRLVFFRLPWNQPNMAEHKMTRFDSQDLPSLLSYLSLIGQAGLCWTPSVWRRAWGRGKYRLYRAESRWAGRGWSYQTTDRQSRHQDIVCNTRSYICIGSDIKTVLHQNIIEAKYFVNRQVQDKLQKRNAKRKSKNENFVWKKSFPFENLSHFMILRKSLFLYFEFGRRLWTSVGNMTNT